MEDNKNFNNKDVCCIEYKKIFFILMVLFFFVMPVEGVGNSSIIVPNVIAPFPGPLTLPIFISNVTNAQGLSFNMTYDRDVATIQNIAPNVSIFPGSTATYTFNNAIGQANISLFNMNGLNATTEKPVMDITFSLTNSIRNFTSLILSNPRFIFNFVPTPPDHAINGGITIQGDGQQPLPPGNGSGSGGGGGGGMYSNYDATVTGRITSNGTPMANASVGVVKMGFGPVNWAFTNATGYYSFGAYTGEGIVFASAPGFVMKKNMTIIQQNNTINLNLTRSNATHGNVIGNVYYFNYSLGMYTGMANALVYAEPEIGGGGGSGGAGGGSITDSTGSYNITGLKTAYPANTSYFLRATARGYPESEAILGVNNISTLMYDFYLASGGTISGTVTDSNGSGVSDANITVFQPWMKDGGTTTTTNATGYYTVTVSSGLYEVMVNPSSGSGLASASRKDVYVSSDMETIVDFTLFPGATVEGFVFNMTGSPVPNAGVNIFQPFWGGFGLGTMTDDMGYYSLSIPEGTYEMEVMPSPESGLTTVHESNFMAVAGLTYMKNYTLGRSGSISGRVTSGATGIANANVNAWSMSGGFGWTQTDMNGYYNLTGLSNGTYEVRVDPSYGSSFSGMQIQGIVVIIGQDTPNVNFALSAGSSISGRVISNGIGVAQASVEAMGRSGGWGRTQTDNNGNYTLVGLSNGTYDLKVFAPPGTSYSNAERRDVNLNGDLTGINFILSAAGSISGRITDNDGTGIANVNVNAWSMQGGSGWASTNMSGYYTMNGLVDGTYEVGAQAPQGSTYASGRITGVVVIAGNITPVNFVLGSGGIIAGRVTDISGAGIANVNMNGWPMGGMGAGGWAQTNSSGYYTLTGLQDGTYEVEAQAPMGTDYASNRTRGISVSAGITTSVNFVLTSGGRISGRVTDMSGTGIANVNMNSWPIGGMGGGAWAQTNSTGYFTLNGLADGMYEVEAQAPPGSEYASNRTRGISVYAGLTTTANFILSSGGRLTGRVTDNIGNGISFSNVNAWSKEGGFGWSQTNSSGYFTVNGLADGNYDVEAQAPWGSDYASNRTRGIEVRSGDITTVNFVLSSGGRLTGRVTNNIGDGVAYANINAWETETMQGGFGWAQTNSTGYYTLNGLQDGTYEVEAQPPYGSDYASNRTRGISVRTGIITTIDFILGSGGIIRGRVTDSYGDGIANSNINAWSTEGLGGWGWAMTDSNGNYTLRGLRDGTYEVEAQAPYGTEYASNRSRGISLTSGTEATLNFVLGSGGKINGRVTDSFGNGISNANINAWSNEGGSGWAQSNSSGYYSLSGLKNGVYEVEAQAPWGTDYTHNRTRGIPVTAGNITIYNFVLGSGGIISGRITDSIGSSVSNANINAWEMGGMGGGWGWTSTNSTGYYTLRGLKDGTYEIQAQAPPGTDYASNRTQGITVSANNITTVNFVLGSGGMISGRVTDSNGAGITNSNVNAWSMSGMGGGGMATTNSTGYYTIKGLKDGTYEVEAQAPWGTEYASNRTQGIAVTAGFTTSLSFVLGSGGMISGRVTDSNGAGIANSNLNAWSVGKVGGWSWTTTNSTGYYTLKGLKASVYEVEAQAPWGTAYASNRTRNVIVEDGATTSNVNLILSNGNQISGRVTSNGAGVSSAFINAWSLQGGSGRAQTDSNGNYTLSGLMDGDYDVRVEPPFGSELTSNSTKIIISGADQTVDFILSGGYSISGRVVDSDGNGISFTNVNTMTNEIGASWAWAQTNASGYFTLRGLNNGTYDVEVQAPWGSTLASSRTRVTINGANLVLDDIELSSGHSISGRVTSSGNGVAYANINAWSQKGGSGWSQTNATGYYTITSLSDATYDIRVEPQFGSGLTSNGTKITIEGSDASGIDFELSTGHSISGQVTSNSTGVAYAFVNAWSVSGGWGWAQANATGHYTISGLGDADYEIRAEPQFGSGLAPNSTRVTLNGVDLTGINIDISSGHSISGTVTSGGTGVHHAIVNAWSQSNGWGWAETDINGNYTIEGLTDAIFEVKVDPPYGSSYTSNSTTVNMTGSDITVNFVLTGGFEMSGRISGTANASIVKARIDAWNNTRGIKGWTETDNSGNYLIKGLMTGVYEVYVSAPSGSGYSDNRTTVTITNSSVTGINMRLNARGNITGRVINNSGFALNNAVVDAWNSTTGLGKSVKTDSNGNFTIRIAPGVYEMKVSYSGLTSNQTSNIVVGAGNNTLIGDIVLSSGKSIFGRVVVAPLTAASSASVVAWNATAGSGYGITNSSGYFTLSGMPDAIYNLTAIYNGITNNTAIATVSGSDMNAGTIIIPKDDGNPNYLIGTLTIGGAAAIAGTQYKVTVTSGDNLGYSYIGAVDDSNVPPPKLNQGYYYTPDRTGFSSGANFELIIIGHDGSTTGTFSTGGNTNVNLTVAI